MLKRFSPEVRRVFHSASNPERITIALGSNVGNRANNINQAVDELRRLVKVLRNRLLSLAHSMYVTNQPSFLNAACEVESDLEPEALLQAVKQIERDLGRDPNGVRNGPRPIDLDIITYGTRSINSKTPDLQVPHPRLREREFVLRPLCDLAEEMPVPLPDGSTCSASDLLQNLQSDGASGLVAVTPTNTGRLLKWGQRTMLMGVINATPDSFSDGGKFNTVDAALRQVERFHECNFDIIDIGGQSTRPGARPISLDEELWRVLPLTEAIRGSFPDMLISADTYNATVAREMIAVGAEMINDISGGRLDANMSEMLAETKAAYVLMHMRGTPGTMQSLTDYDGDVVDVVSKELCEAIDVLLSKDVCRWAVLADPGIGFAKTGAQSARLVGACERVKGLVGGMPILLGASRKSWLKGIGGVYEMDWATAGAVGAAVGRGGVNVVRVHSELVGDAVQGADLVRRRGMGYSLG